MKQFRQYSSEGYLPGIPQTEGRRRAPVEGGGGGGEKDQKMDEQCEQ